jgi:hypothetical protein
MGAPASEILFSCFSFGDVGSIVKLFLAHRSPSNEPSSFVNMLNDVDVNLDETLLGDYENNDNILDGEGMAG